MSATENPVPESTFPSIASISWKDPFRWLCLGLRDMRFRPGESLFFGFCFAIMGLCVTIIFEHAYQYTSAATTGFLLLGPFLAIGLYEISRQRAAGNDVSFAATLVIWRHNAGNIALFSLVLTIIFLIWARASLIIFALFYTSEMPNLTGFIEQITNLENLDFLVVYCGVGLLFAAIVFAVSLVSIPMMLDRNQDAITAMICSVMALFRNPVPCAIWGLLIVLLTIAGFLTFHMGLIFVMPMIGHATWHAYDTLLGRIDQEKA